MASVLSGGLPGDPNAIFSSFQGSERFFFFVAVLQGLQDLSSLTRDQAPGHCCETTEPEPLDSQGSAREVKDLNFSTGVGS